MEIIAVVTDPRPTGWWKDFCQDGALIEEMPECIQIGGQLQRVKLNSIKTLDGRPIAGTAYIGLAGSQLVSNYRQEKIIKLRQAPAPFRKATGLEFIADAWEDT